MTKLEAVGLESLCEKMFDSFMPEATISMALSGKLRIQFDKGFLTFDVATGDVIYMQYVGFADDFDEIRTAIKSVVTVPENSEMLRKLLWSYENRTLLEG